jgi:hypothetical protein
MYQVHHARPYPLLVPRSPPRSAYTQVMPPGARRQQVLPYPQFRRRHSLGPYLCR